MRRSRGKAAESAIDASVQPPVADSALPATHRWTIASDIELIQPIVDAIVTLCRGAGFSARHCQLNVPVAVTEALANAVLKGNGNECGRLVSVHVALDAVRLLVEVSDEGVGFDLSAVQQSPADADWFEREDGRGVFLMQQLMDRVENADRTDAPGHCLRLILHRT